MGIEGPGAWLEGTGGLHPQAEDDMIDQLLLVDGMGEGVTDAPIGEALVFQIEAEIDVAVEAYLNLLKA